MLKAYLDTNIYFISREYPKTNSRIAINAAINEQYMVVQSDYLYEEILTLFKRKYNKNIAGYQRNLMLSLPLKIIIKSQEWSVIANKYRNKIIDFDDLPHICSYFVGKSDFFITVNRRLTQMEIKEEVNFITPKKFVEKLGLNSLNTQNEI
jgi:predicted nucleic acid-binding protein